MAYLQIKRLLPEGLYRDYKAALKLVLLEPNGAERSTIEFKSGENPDSLRGFGVNYFILDEAARVPEESWVSVYTTISQTFGRGIIISTPKGRGWFYDVYQKGQKFFDDGTPKYDNPEDDPDPEWYSIRMPTWANPTVKPEAIKQFKKNMPADVFRQEIAAEFIKDSAGVFNGVANIIRGSFQDPIPGHRYVMGVDLGRKRDFTVINVIDTSNRHVVYFDRFNKIRWTEQYPRIIDVARRYRAIVSIDSTGLGDPVVEAIESAGVRVEPYTIGGSKAKQQLIDKLRIAVERGEVSMPPIAVQRKEMEDYEYEVTDSGVVKYSAPPGKYDDTVVSFALAYWIADVQPIVYRYRKVRGI
jgi:hypothetical protein